MQPNPQESEGNQTFHAPLSDTDLKILLHQYETIVGLYKHHLDLILKTNVFIYAVTGAILSFYFSKPNDSLIKYSLIFPILMNFGYFYFFFISSKKFIAFDRDIKAIILRLGLISYPDIMTIKKILQLSAWLYFAIAISLCLLIILR